MVTLLGDVAANYVQLRTDEKRIELARANMPPCNRACWRLPASVSRKGRPTTWT